jgi:uncharacterized protein
MFIDVQRVAPEGELIDREIPAESAVPQQPQDDVRLVDNIKISARLTPVEEGTFCLMGKMEAAVETNCVRCLEPFRIAIREQLDLLYLPQSKNVGSGEDKDEERELEEEDLAVSFFRDDRIDLNQMIWEQVYLALPMKPLCNDDCRGLCSKCGTNLNLSECGCERDFVDPRLAGLKSLLKS